MLGFPTQKAPATKSQLPEAEETVKEIAAPNFLIEIEEAKISEQISVHQRKLNQFQAQSARRQAQQAANSIRRDLAKDAALGEGLFDLPEVNGECEVAVEAAEWEKVAESTGVTDLLDKYDAADVNEKFEKFYND